MSFEPVTPKVRFPDVEARVLAFWKRADVFQPLSTDVAAPS